MKRIDKIFISTIIVEIILIFATAIILKDTWYPSPCHVQNPILRLLGLKERDICTQQFVPGLNPLTYIVFDLLVLTMISYIVYSVVRILKQEKGR